MGEQRHPDTPLFLYGQSMGSLTAILVSSDGGASGAVRPSGIILHSPAVAMMYTSPLVRLFVAELRSVRPRGLLFSVGLIPGDKPALTNDAQFDRFWGRSVDRVRPGFTWSFFDETLKLGGRARKAVSQLDVPVIVLTGEKDPSERPEWDSRLSRVSCGGFLLKRRNDTALRTATTTLSTTATGSRRSNA